MLCEVEIKYVNSFDTYKPFFSNIATIIQENVCNLHVLSFRRTALCQSGKLNYAVNSHWTLIHINKKEDHA